MIDLNVKCKTVVFLEESIGENLPNLGLGRILRHDTKNINHKRKKLINGLFGKEKLISNCSNLPFGT